MADELDGIDFGADFDEMAVGLEPVTVASINALSGAATVTTEGVMAAKLIAKRRTGPARSGEVWTNADEFWLRVDQLGFVLKPVDQITRGSGETWIVDEVNEVAGTLVRCPVTKKR